MSHIAIDAREIFTSTGRYVERLIHYLQQIDNDNTYSILIKPKDFDRLELTNPNFKKVASPYKEFTFGEQLGFAWQLYKLKPDLVHFGMTQQPLLYWRRSVTTIHDLTTLRFYNPDKHRLVFWIKQQVYKVVILYAAKKSKYVFTPSRYVADDVVSFARVKPPVVTYESADREVDSPVALPYLQNKKYIMYVGRPTPHKNLERLISSFRSVNDPSLHLVLVGRTDTNFKRLQLACQDEPRIIFTDFVTDQQLRWIYENATAYCFPSLSEGFGLPGLEAMQYDVPLASSNATCLPEIYGDAALYFDPLKEASIKDAIERITSDGELRANLVAKGRQQRTKYSWKKMATETFEVYKKALKG